MTGPDWRGYLADFHDARAGITADVLDHARDAAGRTPYDRLVDELRDALPAGAQPRVLDLACGSAPLADRFPPGHYLGVDVSTAELHEARRCGRPVAQADAARVPLADGSVDAVLVSMALMLLPLDAALREVRRVLRPGGVLVATVPHSRPMPVRDALRYARLCLALRHPGLSYPNDAVLRSPQAAFAAAGLRLRGDEAVGFTCRLVDTAVAETLLDSLYLPDVRPERLQAGRRVVRGWAGSSIAVPLRVLVAVTDSHRS